MKTVLLSVLLLTGCTTLPEGVKMTEAEAKECKEFGCAVWTQQDFDSVLRYVFGEGVKAGIQIRGRGI